MKKILNKIMLAAFAGITMVGMAACNLDEKDNNKLTPAEVKVAYESVKGEYTGLLFFNKRKASSPEIERDSVPVSVSLNTDTMLTVKDFPTKALAGLLEDGKLKKAIEEAGTTELKCYIGFVGKEPVAMLVNPLPAVFNINYDGKSQQAKAGFVINSKSSFAQVTGKDQLAMVVVKAAGIYMGNHLAASETGNSALFFRLKRK